MVLDWYYDVDFVVVVGVSWSEGFGVGEFLMWVVFVVVVFEFCLFCGGVMEDGVDF